jgi:3-deoxy-D-manno-octulosonate 8-phosphate phosphatase (KDO 8-P phosphatase)
MGLHQLSRIRAIVSDVDGVMTDGRLYIGPGGETKTFSVRDGLGIKLWQKTGGVFTLLSGRASESVQRRADELGIPSARLGRLDKRTALLEIAAETGVPVEHMAYIGDDLIDLAPIRMAGAAFCPSDAVEEVRAAVDMVVSCPGGAGVVRGVIEIILKARGLWRGVVEELMAVEYTTVGSAAHETRPEQPSIEQPQSAESEIRGRS